MGEGIFGSLRWLTIIHASRLHVGVQAGNKHARCTPLVENEQSSAPFGDPVFYSQYQSWTAAEFIPDR